MIDLTIIIVSWNTKDLLRDCLFSIKQCSNAKGIKVIVVDNSSSDGSTDMLNTFFPDIKVINSGGNIGFGNANNMGIACVDTPLVLFLNPDTLIQENALQYMVQFMNSHPSIGALSCKMKYAEKQTKSVGLDGNAHTLGLQWFTSPTTEFIHILFLSDKIIQVLKRHLPYRDPNKSAYVSKLYGTALMVRKNVLEQVGYFDRIFFMYAEDVDLCKRIKDAGWKMYYLSEAEIIHLAGGATNTECIEFTILMKRESVSKLMKKYYGIGGIILYRIAIFIASSSRLFILIILGLLSFLSPSINKNMIKNSFKKYRLMISWSLNQRKPVIK